ncbi:hypothetical protein [Hoeflea sp. IMCC20628]|uniref:hypothetical protein n=1 Tax=Hoeflea sp. IMCC20628 TaxID=1620421 RepID=UPI000AC1F540|nr:hypothetical protein [Hoeflea sp. IMCC20628]
MIEAAEVENQVTQNAAPEIGYKKPPQQQKGTARKVAEEIGVSVGCDQYPNLRFSRQHLSLNAINRI